MDKWAGEQNGGNHCLRTEYRKKWRQPERPLGHETQQHYHHGVPEGEERKDLRKHLKR